ncbi:CDP-diacylglycerol--serine O-phosphatidyltransferase [Salisediminibacterium halotolerans]|uniref:CDP-diacylglycerol--serine O-phosphatidyltransferase n=1 Tax=Salisediminibacterium halotolerans TaxID=517425 RepID=UPI000EB24858|nr:CDP-diacylglycerol--serine O-phosphatidyltransferase [Salisediminibacterium halotolerans]RLJ78197.1 CDP-diacylglycerol--serine O-phosphatidyltransferase [Actinophytocola xinjiangensis]RPE88464.1 CDP-diacylglycerol--serine O-phosphatidyltransferase [Salisediminibacterium halotolerans]TWG37174.1 CDP-diacylglycerol--serine O-phosphatidyltransferase [Salisediminibacterium halotolerans]GEL09001.1 CDP-diacylglycerol--serine O-phosphatidyltransferase [Salisediminibacterium halotolerans]
MILLQQLMDNSTRRVRSQTANMLTIVNLGLGSMAIIFVLQGQFGLTVALICIAAVFDRMDGKIARKMNIESELGKQLDSLCDLISFGLAPALLIYQSTLQDFGIAGSMAAVIFIACGAIRLARFNVSEQEGYFVGLPITGAGCILTVSHLLNTAVEPHIFMFIILILSILMISSFTIRKS